MERRTIDGGETNWTITGRVPSGRGQRKIGSCGSSMLRPSPQAGDILAAR